ncbi:MAG: hypothetical protein KF768_06055 [Phycisphaeraceae bacterium]|nr:hypothetical protein [Phycisphaeraceae bacterium]
MSEGVSSRLIASCCGLGGFATAVISGMAADNPLDDVLTRALVALAACAAVGMVIGIVAERTIAQAVREYKGGSSGGAAGTSKGTVGATPAGES